eukprot:g3203.t1
MNEVLLLQQQVSQLYEECEKNELELAHITELKHKVTVERDNLLRKLDELERNSPQRSRVKEKLNLVRLKDKMKKDHKEEMKKLTDKKTIELKQMKEELTSEINGLKTINIEMEKTHSEEIKRIRESLKNKHLNELKKMREDFSAEMNHVKDDLNTTHSSAMQFLKDQQEQAISILKEKQAAKLIKMREDLTSAHMSALKAASMSKSPHKLEELERNSPKSKEKTAPLQAVEYVQARLRAEVDGYENSLEKTVLKINAVMSNMNALTEKYVSAKKQHGADKIRNIMKKILQRKLACTFSKWKTFILRLQEKKQMQALLRLEEKSRNDLKKIKDSYYLKFSKMQETSQSLTQEQLEQAELMLRKVIASKDRMKNIAVLLQKEIN